ncbi:transaldolase family protein [Oscillospiraceae bacterium MB08-C2-2]|nr:transaldolase family protein [Oscillospiraceae bacterium MB08-C2-2]
MSYKSPLHQMSQTTPTQFWNDSCSIPELTYALEYGAVGATTNPVIVGQVLKQELETYIPTIKQLIKDMPTATEDEIAWALNESMAVDGAKLLEPAFKATEGKAGYISIQTNAKYYRSAEKIVEQAVHFKGLAPNIMVKMPVTTSGVAAIEESTYQGVNVNATVSFSVPQALAVAEAIERGLARREKDGLDNSGMHPVCTIMVGRVDDWIKDVAAARGITVDPGIIDLAGVATFKNAYKIYKEKGYRTRLLAAAYRNHYHWSAFIGGEVSLTIPHKWIKQFNESDVTCENRMDIPVDPHAIEVLKKHFPEFIQTYEADGMTVEEFDDYAPNRITLNQFLNGYSEMVGIIRKIMLNM